MNTKSRFDSDNVHVAAAQQAMIGRMYQAYRQTGSDLRELDLELDLISARHAEPFYAPVDEMVVAVTVDEYLETDPMAVEDICEGLQAYHSKTSLMPACWGTPLSPPVKEDSQEEYSAGFADNH
jgi:hypothetical protein